MMLQTGSCHCFPFLFLLFSLHLSPILAYYEKDCAVLYTADCAVLYTADVTAGVSVDCGERTTIHDRVPADIPRDIISLSLSNNKIQNIHRTDFYHLSNLTVLNLISNVITHVDDGAFVPLVQLKELYMNGNKLTTLTDNMFQGLSNLLTLTLDDNNITFINPAAFQSLTSLQELSLRCNHITEIIPILQLPSLQILDIHTDELEYFQSKDLSLNMSSELRELRLMSNSIKMFSITTAVFPHLKTIDLSGCCNDASFEWDIPDKYFLRNITTVYLQGFNSITKALQSLDSLEYLKLNVKGLSNTACQIPTLRKLDISYAFSANTGEILSCIRLTYLNLSDNNISKVPDEVQNLSMLQILILRENYILGLSCSDFLNLTRLTHLHLDRNYIQELKPCVFQHLNELKVLTLSDNSIFRFGDTFKTGLQKLELLDLNNNVVTILNPGDFASLKSLRHLKIELGLWNSHWQNEYFEGLVELETLSLFFYRNPGNVLEDPTNLLSLNNFTTGETAIMTVMFTMMKTLEHFVAESFHDGELGPDTFNDVPQLKTLSLRNGDLTYLSPEIFIPIQHLESLDLTNNKLKSLDFLAQANLTRISRLDLSQNELTVINVSVFSFLPALRYVNMAGNALACDCSNYDFQQWLLKNNQTQVVFAHSYTCGFPLAKEGTKFLDFDYHSCLVDTSFSCFISSTCAIVLTLLISFIYHFLRLHLLYAYYLFLAFLYDAKKRKRGSPERYDAFISYNVHDELWVCREMLPVLEGEQGWRLCLHHRDFLPGKPIIENIADAIYGSRKTICVISHHYLESEWCSREFQMASYRLFDEQKDVLILVFLEDIPAHQLSPYYHMRRLMKRHTYLSWSQAGQHPGLFWQNLRRALDTPHTDLDLNQ